MKRGSLMPRYAPDLVLFENIIHNIMYCFILLPLILQIQSYSCITIITSYNTGMEKNIICIVIQTFLVKQYNKKQTNKIVKIVFLEVPYSYIYYSICVIY